MGRSGQTSIRCLLRRADRTDRIGSDLIDRTGVRSEWQCELMRGVTSRIGGACGAFERRGEAGGVNRALEQSASL